MTTLALALSQAGLVTTTEAQVATNTPRQNRRLNRAARGRRNRVIAAIVQGGASARRAELAELNEVIAATSKGNR